VRSAPAPADASPATAASPAGSEPPPPVYGGRSETAGKGGVGATWGLFGNAPAANPFGSPTKD